MALRLVGLAMLFLRGSACADENQFCSFWAADGECQNNPGYMLFHCAKSCGACGGETTTEAAETTTTTTAGPPATTSAEVASTSVATSAEAATTSAEIATTSAEVASTSVATTTKAKGGQCAAFDTELNDTDLAGTLLLAWQAVSMDDCCSKCDRTNHCEGVSFGYGTCYLKGFLSGTYSQHDIKTRLHSTSGDCSGFDEVQHDVDLAGQLLGTVFASSSDACCSSCGENAQCQGFSYFEQMCYLKSNVQGVYSKAGCMVQVKSNRRLSPVMI